MSTRQRYRPWFQETDEAVRMARAELDAIRNREWPPKPIALTNQYHWEDRFAWHAVLTQPTIPVTIYIA